MGTGLTDRLADGGDGAVDVDGTVRRRHSMDLQRCAEVVSRHVHEAVAALAGHPTDFDDVCHI